MRRLIILLAFIVLLATIMTYGVYEHKHPGETRKAYDELLNEHLVLISRYEKLEEEVEELRRELESLRANCSELRFKAFEYWKALMLLGNRSMVLRLKVAAPYEEGFKYGVIEVKIPLWKYALYKVCGDSKRLGLDPHNDTVLHDIVKKVRKWLIHEGIFDEERFANALVSIVQLLPYNESAGGYPVETLVEGGVCGNKALLAVVLLRLAGYEAAVIGYADHAIIGVCLSKPPRFAIKLGRQYWTPPQWVDDPEHDAWYVVFKGRRYYLVGSVSHDTIGSQLGVEAIINGDVVIGWPYHGEKPEKIHAPPYREE
ncbi:MAG: hypothetical protein DRJ60_00910 [Thermoprotei archaeon]|nr:MAG: hypothetical protein DRJ60_00910 [Thermoprotei archaeon]